MNNAMHFNENENKLKLKSIKINNLLLLTF